MSLSDYAKDKHIAPGMSAFTTAKIEDMSETSAEQRHWVGNFLLNSIFRAQVKGPTKPTLRPSQPPPRKLISPLQLLKSRERNQAIPSVY
jgi:hypothetical protein